jgi:hypothetical protein
MIQPFRVAALQLAFDRFVLVVRLFVLPARFDGAASVVRPPPSVHLLPQMGAKRSPSHFSFAWLTDALAAPTDVGRRRYLSGAMGCPEVVARGPHNALRIGCLTTVVVGMPLC